MLETIRRDGRSNVSHMEGPVKYTQMAVWQRCVLLTTQTKVSAYTPLVGEPGKVRVTRRLISLISACSADALTHSIFP